VFNAPKFNFKSNKNDTSDLGVPFTTDDEKPVVQKAQPVEIKKKVPVVVDSDEESDEEEVKPVKKAPAKTATKTKKASA
jgi:hypothetical protein